jgi:hypothetical protein
MVACCPVKAPGVVPFPPGVGTGVEAERVQAPRLKATTIRPAISKPVMRGDLMDSS